MLCRLQAQAVSEASSEHSGRPVHEPSWRKCKNELLGYPDKLRFTLRIAFHYYGKRIVGGRIVKRRDNDLITRIENYVEEAMVSKEGHLLIAHDFKHVDRVRNWSLRIAEGEGFSDLQVVQVAALLHDIGLSYIYEESERGKHGQVGAEIADRFLNESTALSKDQVEQTTLAIRYHSSRPSLVADLLSSIGERGKLIEIIRDADTMDAIGAVGLMRAFTSKYSLPEYEPDNSKGETWGLSSDGFTERLEKGVGIGKCIVDQVNFQISLYENLQTKTAKQLARPLVEFMSNYVLQLEHEIKSSRNETVP